MCQPKAPPHRIPDPGGVIGTGIIRVSIHFNVQRSGSIGSFYTVLNNESRTSSSFFSQSSLLQSLSNTVTSAEDGYKRGVPSGSISNNSRSISTDHHHQLDWILWSVSNCHYDFHCYLGDERHAGVRVQSHLGANRKHADPLV
jgi:hypothetical protein